ncbi:MAG: hydroxysqualene dehydroxylase HpnE [Gammaproteobacteria bacterium]|nr:hydroxysqualene dehydroxylase HpnE [Gammaproteobacteria bacterium]MDD2928213.1 hydroxysqualene dehydroxylase HpnE [Sideroxydans sp.]MDD5470535.1 hydroxysqualene dehydroxylase HpnE [Sideroxydans sp.]
MAEELKVGIIGGGYAGMAAAAELSAAGIPVTVFESARQLGGRARGVSYGDTQLDNGQHLLLGCYRETLRLIELVGGDIERDFLRLPMQLDLHHHLELRAPRLPAPLHLLFALLNAKGLSWRERVKAARFMLALRSINFQLPRDMTVAELLRQHGQEASLTLKFWEPLTIAALNTPIAKASAQVLLNVLRDALNRARANSDMLLPSIDFTALFPQRAAGFVEDHGGKVHLSQGVDAIIPEGQAIALQSAQCRQRFSHVICATSPGIAEKLLRPLPQMADTVRKITTLEQQPIYTVYVQYPAQVRLPHPMIGLHRRISQWLFDKGRIAGQHGLLACVISAEGIHQEMSQEVLAQKVIVELREEFGITEAPQWHKVIAEKRATFCCAPDLQRPSQLTALPRLLLAGDYTAGEYPATLEGAVMSGLECARLVKRSVSSDNSKPDKRYPDSVA